MIDDERRVAESLVRGKRLNGSWKRTEKDEQESIGPDCLCRGWNMIYTL